MNILARFFATRAECAQLVADLQEVIRDRDRWAALAQQLAEQNRCQRENFAFASARADALREALRALLREAAEMHGMLGVPTDMQSGIAFTAARKALGEEELDG